MKALVKSRREPGLWMEDVPVPAIGPNDVLIRIHTSAICGTDMHIWNWDAWSQKTIPVPMHVGHEYAGVIEKVGAEVEGYKVGDRVSGEGHIVCGHCRNCRAGKRHLCPNTMGVGVNRPGSFAEYLSLPASNLFKLPRRHLQRDGRHLRPVRQRRPHGPLLQHGGRGRAHHRRRPHRLHGRGHRQVRGGPQRGHHRRERLPPGPGPEDGRHPGRGREPGEACKTVMTDLGMTEGFDVGLEMSGNGPAFKGMLDAMANGGRIALLGIFSDDVAIDWGKVIFKGLFLKGIYGREMFETWYKMAAMIQGGLDISPVITHRFPIDDFRQGFEVDGQRQVRQGHPGLGREVA